MKKIIKILAIMLFMFIGIEEVKAVEVYKCSNKVSYFGFGGETQSELEYYIYYPKDDSRAYIQIISDNLIDGTGTSYKIKNTEPLTMIRKNEKNMCGSRIGYLPVYFDGEDSINIISVENFNLNTAALVYSADYKDYWQISKADGKNNKMSINIYNNDMIYVNDDNKEETKLFDYAILLDAISLGKGIETFGDLSTYNPIYYNKGRDGILAPRLISDGYDVNVFKLFLNETLLNKKINGTRPTILAVNQMMNEYNNTLKPKMGMPGYLSGMDEDSITTGIKYLEGVDVNSQYFCENSKNISEKYAEVAEISENILETKINQLHEEFDRFDEKYKTLIDSLKKDNLTIFDKLPKSCDGINTMSINDDDPKEFVNYINMEILEGVHTTDYMWNKICSIVLDRVSGVTTTDVNELANKLNELRTDFETSIAQKSNEGIEKNESYNESVRELKKKIDEMNKLYSVKCGDDWLKEESDRLKISIDELGKISNEYAKEIKRIKSSTIVGSREITTCEDLIPQEIRDMIQDILGYVRVLVPILVIVLGMLDFGKAALASKEDEMKKAQNKFVKRLIIAVVVFFVPTILDIMFEIINELGISTSSCGIK